MQRLAKIPERFLSEETGKPFKTCSDCGTPLDQPDQGYIIQKAVAKGEVIMEVAICQSCHEKLQQAYSKETMEAIWNFYLDHVDFEGRLQKFRDCSADSPSPWLNGCVACEATMDASEEYVMVGHCVGDQMVFGEFPWTMCGACLEKMTGLISEASRDEYDRWMERCLPMAPADVDDPFGLRVFV